MVASRRPQVGVLWLQAVLLLNVPASLPLPTTPSTLGLSLQLTWKGR